MKFAERLVMAWAWASLIAGIGFLMLFSAPQVIGGPGAGQAPLLAFLQLPVSFILSLLIVAILPKAATFMLGLMLTASGLYCFSLHEQKQQALEEYRADFALHSSERALLQEPPWGLRVEVRPGEKPSALQQQLIDELAQQQRFSQVGPPGEVSQPDLIVTLTDSYYGSRIGHAFELSWWDRPDFSQSVQVWRWVGDASDLYQQRFEVELVKAVQSLQQQRY